MHIYIHAYVQLPQVWHRSDLRPTLKIEIRQGCDSDQISVVFERMRVVYNSCKEIRRLPYVALARHSPHPSLVLL